MSDARKLSIRCLLETERGGYSNLVFKRLAARQSLSENDTAFAAALFYGTLERAVTLDDVLGRFLSRPIQELDAEIRAILRGGLYQVHYMSVPVYAAVNESVRLCGAFKKQSASKLVNAVLRKAADFDLRHLLDGLEGIKMLSVAYSLNQPLAGMLVAQYGERADEMMKGFFVRTPAAVRVNTLKTTPAAAAARLGEERIPVKPAGFADALLVLSGNAAGSKAFLEGLIRPQSLAAQAAVAALNPLPGTRMLDLCAAPGGKTLTAAQMMRNSGEIIAFDRHENRLKLIEERAKAEGVAILRTVQADSSETDDRYALFADYVLCDVPCSGYGEIVRKPELRARPPRVDKNLEEMQYRILENGMSYLKPGGRLVYSTCTVDRRENEGVCLRFLQNHPECQTLPAPLPAGFTRDENGFYLLLPSYTDGEGFFVAVFSKEGQ